MKKIKCPVCGVGEIKAPKETIKKQRERAIKRVVVKALHKEGFSIREIMRFVNYKSTRSILKIINGS